MHRLAGYSLAIALGLSCLSPPSPASAQLAISISVDAAPPPLPIYDQPPIPADGYIWAPGYWSWNDDVGYYWVPGTWVLPPEPELLWTPAYWGWNDGVYAFHAGYWGPTVGFYGGIAYGCGYTGSGYDGGYWRGGSFFYNRTVNNITNVSITNVYNKTVIINNRTTVSYNGGAGGTTLRPTPEQVAAEKERHVPATAEQTRHAETALKDPAMSLARNHGHPSVAATAHPAQFSGAGIVAAHPGKPIAAPPPRHALPAAEKPHAAGAPAQNEKRAAAPPKPQISRPATVAPHAVKPPAPHVARAAPHRPAAAPPRRPPPPHVARPAPRRAPPPRPHPAPHKHR